MRMLFLTFGNANIRFAERELVWRIYTIAEALLTTKQIEFFIAKEFAMVVLGNSKSFYGPVLKAKNVDPFCQAQITSLDVKNVPIAIPTKYLDYTNVVLLDFAARLLKHTSLLCQVAHRCSNVFHPQEKR